MTVATMVTCTWSLQVLWWGFTTMIFEPAKLPMGRANPMNIVDEVGLTIKLYCNMLAACYFVYILNLECGVCALDIGSRI